ncbi:MAG: DoxX family protein [Bacteroidales bacterium]|nr:DoxX family protein [Bacteroidales bacterium]
MKVLHFISRIVIGVVFIFSGFVKGIDPLGNAYRFEDYFIAWGTNWMMPYALTLSILLCTMEFVLGVVVMLNLKPKVNAWILLGVMAFFTLLTLNDAIYNPVPDCGCFGDAIKLTNWETFYKNVVLMIFTLILFSWRNKTRETIGTAGSYGIAAAVIAIFMGLSIYCYRHLPLIDFMSWKTGNKMYNDNPLPVKYYLTYKNKETGETKEYLSPDYPYNDSVWMSQWEFFEQRVEDPNVFQGHDLQIMDSTGTDLTDVIIQNPDYQFILVTWDIEKADQEALSDIGEFADKAVESGFGFIGLTSSLSEIIDSTRTKLKLNFDIYMADDIALKIMVRANPGLLLLKGGIVIDKWHYNDFPAYGDFEKKYVIPDKAK